MDKKIEIYTSSTCHFCHDAKDFFNERSIAYTEYDVSEDAEKRKELVDRSQQMGVPVIFIEGAEMIIGFDKPKIMEALNLSE